MLLAALGHLHAKVAGSKRSKVVETSIAQIAGIFKLALTYPVQQQASGAAGQLTTIQQVCCMHCSCLQLSSCQGSENAKQHWSSHYWSVLGILLLL